MIKPTPSPENLYLGAGSVFFDRFDSAGESTGLRHLGNVDTLEISMNVETSEKKNAMDGTKATYAEIVTAMTAELAATLTEYVPENVALAVMGDAGVFTQTTKTATDQAFGPAAANVKFDVWYELGCVNAVVTSLKQGSTPLNAAAYEVKPESGLVRLRSDYAGTGKASEGQAITWTGSAPAITATQGMQVVQGMSTGSIKGRLHYESAENQSVGPRVLLDVWVCGLNPEGALGLITEDFGTFQLKGKVYADTTREAGEQYFRLIYL